MDCSGKESSTLLEQTALEFDIPTSCFSLVILLIHNHTNNKGMKKWCSIHQDHAFWKWRFHEETSLNGAILAVALNVERVKKWSWPTQLSTVTCVIKYCWFICINPTLMFYRWPACKLYALLWAHSRCYLSMYNAVPTSVLFR